MKLTQRSEVNKIIVRGKMTQTLYAYMNKRKNFLKMTEEMKQNKTKKKTRS
jgi:hypothetical protein